MRQDVTSKTVFIAVLGGSVAAGAVVAALLGVGKGYVIGSALGVGAGSAISLLIAGELASKDREKDRQQIQRLIYEHVQQPNSQVSVKVVSDPLALEALDALTSNAVIAGVCCHCDSTHAGLSNNPFNPAYHAEKCLIPYSRYIVSQSGPLPIEREVTSSGVGKPHAKNQKLLKSNQG